MIRIGFTEIALFATPFVLYAVFLTATRAGVMDPESWPLSRLITLAILSFVLVIGSFIYFANYTGAPVGSHLCAGAYGERQIRAAGRVQVMAPPRRPHRSQAFRCAVADRRAAAAPARRARPRGRGGARGRRRGAQRAARHERRRNRRRHDGGAGRGRAPRAGGRLQGGAHRHRARHRHRGGGQDPVRGDHAAPGRGDLRPPRQGRLRPRLEGRRRAARLHHQCVLGPSRRRRLRLCRRARRS